MRRWLIAAAVVGLGILCFRARDRDGDEVRTGWWRGTTTQGLPIEFHVDEVEGTPVIDLLRLRFELACERSARIVRAGLGADLRVPIHERKFDFRLATPFWWDEWRGGFSDRSDARGAIDAVWAVLHGANIDTLTSEKCGARGVTFVARAGAGEQAPDARPLDLDLRIARDGTVQVVRAP